MGEIIQAKIYEEDARKAEIINTLNQFGIEVIEIGSKIPVW